MTLHKSQYFPAIVNFVLVKLQKNEWRGKHKFYLWLAKHYGHKVIVHRLAGRAFCVPVGEWCFWLDKGPENYYLDEFIPFCEVLSQLEQPFSFFDLGADIGTVSALVASRCQNIANVVAFEPNAKSFELLEYNLSHLNLDYSGVNSAVSNFEGKVRFNADPLRLNDHEGFIDTNAAGDTLVTSIDKWQQSQNNLQIEKNIAFKVDVEGQEVQAIEGASKLIQGAEKAVLLVEIHPDVLSRNQQTPEDLFEAAEKVRAFDWTIPLYKDLKIDRSLPLFQQVSEGQYDIIGVSNQS